MIFVTGDLGNAFVQADTIEKVYSIAGPEFGDKEDAVFLIKTSLCGLSTSARQWSLALSDQIRDMCFNPARADTDLWVKESDD